MTDFRPLVLDASAAVEMVIRSLQGRWLQNHLDRNCSWHAPEFMQIEVGMVLRRYELNAKLSRDRVLIAFEQLLILPIRLVGITPLLREAWQCRHQITLTDASYVVLARHLNATLVTTDVRLTRAPDLGVETLLPPTVKLQPS
ncbi:MAG: type II toxin-antitoxin system VapC family toxin [Candidatus Dormibacteraceae bacterium]